MRHDMSAQKPVILFDGVCGLCNRFVDFTLRIDRRHVFLFSPLQGKFAAHQLSSDLTFNLRSIVVIEEGKIHMRSDAVIYICRRIGGIWSFASVFLLVPRFIRDAVYDFIANNRYRWFKKRDSCRLPAAKERAFFVD